MRAECYADHGSWQLPALRRNLRCTCPDNVRSTAPCAARNPSNPTKRAVSPSGLIFKCMSAISAVMVRRGSISTMRMCGRLAFGCRDTLIEHRMTPGQIRARQHDEIGQFQILIGAGNGIRPESAPMSRHRRRHAQPRIGVDIGGADETFHQLVGDIVIFRQKLAGNIECYAVRPMLAYGFGKAACHQIKRCIPACGLALYLRFEQPSFQIDGLAKSGAFRAKTPEIGGVQGVTRDANRLRSPPWWRERRSLPRNKGRWCERWWENCFP